MISLYSTTCMHPYTADVARRHYLSHIYKPVIYQISPISSDNNTLYVTVSSSINYSTSLMLLCYVRKGCDETVSLSA